LLNANQNGPNLYPLKEEEPGALPGQALPRAAQVLPGFDPTHASASGRN